MTLKIITAENNEDLESKSNLFFAGFSGFVLVKTLLFRSQNQITLLIFYSIK